MRELNSTENYRRPEAPLSTLRTNLIHTYKNTLKMFESVPASEAVLARELPRLGVIVCFRTHSTHDQEQMFDLGVLTESVLEIVKQSSGRLDIDLFVIFNNVGGSTKIIGDKLRQQFTKDISSPTCDVI